MQPGTGQHRLDVASALKPDVPLLEAPEERVGQLRRQCIPAGVADHKPPAGRKYPRHLVDRSLWVGEVVQRGRTDECREAPVVEGVRIARSEQEVDVLVNNPGLGVTGAAEESSIEQARALFDTNLFGSIRMTRAVLPQMRERGSGRIINLSSVLGLVPAPFGALYAATEHAMEGYSESLDHELREHGVRVLLVEPAYTRTSFDANAIPADEPLPVYAQRREVLDVVIAEAIKGGDEASVVGAAIVAAATDPRPKLRYPAGPLARRVSKLRRYAPSTVFDRQIRKVNQLNGPAGATLTSPGRNPIATGGEGR